MIIEAEIINYLIAENIPRIGDHVYAETPVDPPDHYILVSRTSGGSANWIRSFTMYTEVVSRTDKLTAATIHEAVVEAMLRMRDSAPVFSCRLNSDYDATRPEKQDYRFQALWQITT